ncbi:MAG: hypothetical protein BGO43_03745 [Gammaproteobacteria bacterium 39-13]|nr:PD-(D/E)XK nuclease family protein [Gammaproteobacteria bacterium]OJV96507.1 MAG: hypothetical protein BGO43_03745 [Gammaproteobacteria bacterium 39-13]
MTPKKAVNPNPTTSLVPLPISRSNIELFLNCPRCFYLKQKLGLKLPDNSDYMLNHAVDKLLKREFNHYRLFALKHPIMKEFSVDAIPFFHQKMPEWQDALNGGIKFHHEQTNFMVTGAIDDLWINAIDEIIVVDYKATAIKGTRGPTGKWLKSCQRQLDVYAWLLNKNGFKVHQIGYFLYCNGDTSQKKFNVTLNFNVSLIPHTIDTSWIEDVLHKAARCLQKGSIPSFSKKCQICNFLEKLEAVELY